MKLRFIKLSVLFFFLANGIAFSQDFLTLDDAVKNGALEIEARLRQGSKVVVLNFTSQSQRFSTFVLDEMMTELVRNAKLIVVDRANLELIQQEMNFQLSGEVSDSSAQSIGQKLGAQSIISGSIDDMGNFYRMRFKTISVETAAIQVLSSFNVRKDQITAMMGTPGRVAAQPITATPAIAASGGNSQAGFLNLAVGLGSFLMGDVFGGLLIGGLEVGGVVLLSIGLYNLDIIARYPNFFTEEDSTLSIIYAGAGAGLVLVAVVTGFIRPNAYNPSGRVANAPESKQNPMDSITVVPLATKNGMGMGVFYSNSF